MTGLSLATDALIEIAVIVTDDTLEPLHPGIEVIIKPPTSSLEQMSEFVRDMHQKSGLLEKLSEGISLSQGEELLIEYLRNFGVQPGKSPLAGNSLIMDRNFLARDMSDFEKYLHYRVIDVSSIKELVKRWYPKVYFAAPEKNGNHRALGDALDSINELRYYREHIFLQDVKSSLENL